MKSYVSSLTKAYHPMTCTTGRNRDEQASLEKCQDGWQENSTSVIRRQCIVDIDLFRAQETGIHNVTPQHWHMDREHEKEA